ncbi:uncharacterized protein LOC111262585 [Varroa jacobsoni]|uniref:uncharacterized protein LOC111262585 n=1 Tax=Varroa jacobsoni TaxID=62625 RepID=UPI000BF80344|nr:uncharacterized protein LOC111262585 [Varroa jacobsoni]
MFDDCSHNDMRSWFERHIQRMEEDLRSRNLYHLLKVDPQRRRRVFEEMFMSTRPRSQSPQDDIKVLCELATNNENFGPEDIEVTLKGREIIVHARKEINLENGFSLREVKRSFKIAEGFDLDKLSAHLTESKIVIKAPMLKEVPEKRTGNVEIKVRRIDDDNLDSTKSGIKRTEAVNNEVKNSTQNKDAEVKSIDKNIDVDVTGQIDTRNTQSSNELVLTKDVDLSEQVELDRSYEIANLEVSKQENNEYVFKRSAEIKSHGKTELKNIDS